MLNRPRSLVCANKATISTENELPRRCFLIRLPFPSRLSPFFSSLAHFALAHIQTHFSRKPVRSFVRSFPFFLSVLRHLPLFFSLPRASNVFRALIFPQSGNEKPQRCRCRDVDRDDNNHTRERVAMCPFINNRAYPRRLCSNYDRARNIGEIS